MAACGALHHASPSALLQRPHALVLVTRDGQACVFSSSDTVMSKHTHILQILPAAGWVAVYDEHGEESAATLVCLALVESADSDGKRQDVRPMRAEGRHVIFADEAPNFLRVEELADFEADEDDDYEEEDAEA